MPCVLKCPPMIRPNGSRVYLGLNHYAEPLLHCRYALRVLCSGVMETLGRENFSGGLKHEVCLNYPATGRLMIYYPSTCAC